MTIAEGRELYPIHKLVESSTFLLAVTIGCFNVEHILDIASVVNAFFFACSLLFVFIVFFFIPFLPESPFWVFNPPGNRFFIAPVFA